MLSTGGLDTPEIVQIKARLKKMEDLVSVATEEYKRRVTEIYSNLELQDSHVLKSFSSLSGMPVDKLTEDDRDKLRLLEETLAIRVIGQDEPRKEIAMAVRRSRLGLKMQNKPSGTFMFLGPSGVGKTELAKSLADALSVPLLRFDMSEYMERHAVAKLIGAPPGYEGYEHGGILTNAARRNPYSVVLFDEIEKAHSDVFNLMLQLLDDARLTDSRGLTASFSDAIILMTTNIGTTYFLDESLPFEAAKELALGDLREHYRPEFLGRFGGNIYCFQRLGLEVLKSICKKDLARINTLIKGQGLKVEMPDSDITSMIHEKYVVREGARSVLGFIDRNIPPG
jgi:ATP-dependent Clp protease ATP-binding subunit ClpB